ncbi:MAG: sugar-binding protein [Bacteroidales bacterium]
MLKVYKFLFLGAMMALAVTVFGQGIGVMMTATPPTIDGDVSDAAWDAASSMAIDNVSSGMLDDAFAAEFKLLWDADNLYLSISVEDDTLRNDNKPSGFAQDQNDFIDIYIDMDRLFPYTQNRDNGSWWNLYDVNDFQVQLLRDDPFMNIGGQFPGQTINAAASGITSAQAEVTGGYTIEVAIPFDNLVAGGFDAVHNARLGFEVMVGDADGDTLRDGRLAWNMAAGVDLAWQNPKLWGLIVLDDGSGASLPAVNPAVEMAVAPPTIDGDADAMWTEVPYREIANTSSGKMDVGFAAEYKTLWDATNLYLLVDIMDDTMRNDNKPSGFAQDQNDYVDLYIDMDRLFPFKANKDNGSWWNTYDLNDFQVQLLRNDPFLNIGGQNPNQTINAAASGIISAQTEKADGSGWMLEVQIPFTNLDAEFMAEHNARLGFEIMVGDADGDTLRDGRVAWNMPAGVDMAWGDPTEWGVLVLSDGSAISAPAEGPEIMEAASAPVIDGTIDALWGSVDFREIRNTTSGVMDGTFVSEFKAVWDATNLYLLVEIQDDILKNDNKPSGFAQDQNDYIDLYLDTDMKFPYTTTQGNGSWWNYYDTTDFQIQFLRDAAFLNIGTQNGANDVDSAASGITFAQAEVSGGWLLEVSIPWANMDPDFLPAHDTPIGLEVMVGDADTDTVRNGRNAWFMTKDLAWQQPLLWGTVILSDGGDITTKVLSLSNDLLTTSVGMIDGGSIIEIPQGTKAAELADAVTVSPGATAEVFQGGSVLADPENTDIAEGMVLRIWSEKGLWNDVALVLEAVPSGLFEDFNNPVVVDSAVWFTANPPIFTITMEEQAMKYEMAQEAFHNGVSWQVKLLDLTENPRISLDIKIEDATYDDLGGGGPAPAATLPVQISIWGADETGTDVRAGNFTIDVPAAALGEGTYITYFYDMTMGDAWDADLSPSVIDSVTWILFETVKWPGVHNATIWIDNVAIGDEALEPPLPKKTGYLEDFEGEINMDIWDANRGEHPDGHRIFTVSGDNGTLKVEMDQLNFPDGEMFIFTEEEWVLDVSDPDNQIVTMKIKVEDATYDGGTGPVAIPTIPFQVSLFADIDDPATEGVDRTRVAAKSFQIPVSATGEGEFKEYIFDFAPLIASASAHKQEQAANIWAILCETVQWPGTHEATYWLDDVRMGDEVVPYIPSSDATIHATIYGELGEGEITMVDPTVSVTAFKLGITVNEKATLQVLDGPGGSEVTNPDRTDVATDMVVLVTAEDGSTMEYTITTDPTGIGRLNGEVIDVYPNPSHGILNISNIAAFELVKITNITGQTIHVEEVTGNNMQLDISGYDAGVYFLRLENDASGSIVKKFIKK